MTEGNWGGYRPGSGRPMKGDEKRVTVSFTVTPSQVQFLDDLAAQRGVSRSDALGEAIGRYMKAERRRARANPNPDISDSEKEKGSPMLSHADRYRLARERYRNERGYDPDRNWTAALWLLTADERVWGVVSHAINPQRNEINWGEAKRLLAASRWHHETTETLLQAAEALFAGSGDVKVEALGLLDPQQFEALTQALSLFHGQRQPLVG